MNTSHQSALPLLKGWKLKAWMFCGTALAFFAAGSLITARLIHVGQARADSNRVFQLLVYHTQPGKVPILESIFRDDSKLQAKHGLDVIGYWIPDSNDPAWANTFIYIVAHPNREEATKNWRALRVDPESAQYIDAASKILEKVDGKFRVDEPYMHPAEFSPMK